MKKFKLLLFLIVFSMPLYAQLQDNKWYFGGSGAGVHFYDCIDSVFENGNGSVWEGCVTMSDEQTGELLFYSNGLHIFNANHDTMSNGFNAGLSNSITQNIAIKKPGSNHLYYFFTADVQGGISSNPYYPNAIGVNYAEIDMNLNGGLGGVISKFNILKDTSNCEKLTAGRHANGQDIWLIGHEYGNNNFFVYSITSSGINTTPDYYSVGPVIKTHQQGIAGLSNFDAIGELKASPNGTKLAFTTYYNGITALVDFDNSTGAISNPIQLNINDGGYGVSFSPDNLKLYIGAIDTATNFVPAYGKILQFDISSGVQSIIQNSKTIIYNQINCGFSSLKISPNRTIIVSHYGTSGSAVGDGFLGEIHYPDSLGFACNYIHSSIHLKGKTSSWGLNNQMENPNYCIPTSTIENTTPHNSISVFPNPTTGEFMVTYPLLGGEKASFELYDNLGKIISANYVNSNSTLINFNMSHHLEGIYYLRIKTNFGFIINKKVVLIK
ncbi:MAG: T9SS type A sorting domain-containing protein [Bacteroidia bacterium]